MTQSTAATLLLVHATRQTAAQFKSNPSKKSTLEHLRNQWFINAFRDQIEANGGTISTQEEE